ncbi:MAG: NAD(P)/FAD-dependent oxidoreductase [Sphingorhabdus sp.]
MQTELYDAIILGAGGAGLLCAATAGQRGRRVLLIDHADAPGKKILISGGGRCNFTNVNAVTRFASERYLSSNPHFAKSALGRYKPQDFINLVEAHGIAYHEKTLGQLFCDGSARQIVEMLLAECEKGAVDMALSSPPGEISNADGLYRVAYGDKAASAPSLVIATGGPSIPKMGASAFAYDLARQFRLKVVEPRPALVPLTLGGEDVLFRELSGISADVVVRCGKTKFREAALITHRGLSGPAILQISSYWHHGDAVGINFLPDMDVAAMLLAAKGEHPRATLDYMLERHLPGRLADILAERITAAAFPDAETAHGQSTPVKKLSDWPHRKLEEAGRRVADWQFHPNGTEGFAKAEVTIGGISTDGLSQKTMEAKAAPGLYAIGEAVDVTGWLGGYNFQWAWASAVAAGEVV